jgi:aminomethyltransferase
MSGRSPLHDLHGRLGARFVDFGGWEMPVQYESVLAEHTAVREHAGWFDVSHLGRFEWGGPEAVETARRLLCNDLARIDPGRTQYTMMLNDAGGIVDDIVVWRWEEDRCWILPNAANHERVMGAFRDAGADAVATDLRPSTVTLAVQGPDAPAALEAVLGAAPRRFRTLTGTFQDVPFWAAGTGYTGERGGEVTVPVETAEALAEALTEAGVVPCGLGARDTLRLEAGLPLWGQDLDEATTPLEAGLDFAVAFDHDFVGRDALQRQLDGGTPKRRVAFRTEGRRIPRPHYRLRTPGAAGWVSSGNFSPVLGCGIGLGYLAPPDDDGTLEVEIRGTWIPVERTSTPFIR